MAFKIVVFFVLGLFYFAQVEGDVVDCQQKKAIVNLHNELRMRLAKGELKGQPKAANMQMMVWDDTLAKQAQAWADRQEFEHSDGKYGENLAWSGSSEMDRTPDWNSAITDWFAEHKDFKYGPYRHANNIGHYTQIIWAETTHVGCGYKTYVEDGFMNKLYVCQYLPAGNMLTKAPYKTGKGCENLCCVSQCGRLYGNHC